MTDGPFQRLEKKIDRLTEKLDRVLDRVERKSSNAQGLLTENQVAERLALPTRTLQDWRYKGKGPPYVKLGRSVRYKPSDLNEWIDEHHRTSTTEASLNN